MFTQVSIVCKPTNNWLSSSLSIYTPPDAAGFVAPPASLMLTFQLTNKPKNKTMKNKTSIIIIAALLAITSIGFSQSGGQITTMGNVSTGTGAVVLQTSPTINSPTISNATLTGTTSNVSGTGTLILGTGTNSVAGNLTASGTISATSGVTIPVTGNLVLNGTATGVAKSLIITGTGMTAYITGTTGINFIRLTGSTYSITTF